jgi:hypothetical protein
MVMARQGEQGWCIGQGGKTEPKKCGYEKDKLPEKPFFPLKVLPCLPVFPLFLVLSQPKCKKPTLVRGVRLGGEGHTSLDRKPLYIS